MRSSIFVCLITFCALAQQPKAPAPEPAKPPATTAPAPAEPRERRQTYYRYDLNGQPIAADPNVIEQRRGTGAAAVVEREETRRDALGRPIAAVASQEQVSSEKDGERSGERVVVRYDLMGKPAGKQVVKFERKKMPDGSVVSTDVVYEQDLNGRLQFSERRTTTEKKTADGGGTTAVLVERPGINSGTQVVERIDRAETKRGGAVTESVSSRQLLDGNGRLTERERESSVMTKSGDTTSTETSQWQVGATGQLDFISRSFSRMKEAPDGSQVEDAEVYASKIAGTTPDLNRPQVPTLEQQIHREKKVRPDGKTTETTSARLRQVVDPTRLGGLVVTEQVTTPTAEGKSIQTVVSERDPNGKMVKIRSEVVEEKK